MWEDLRIPVFALMDADPHGVFIIMLTEHNNNKKIAIPPI